MRIELYSSDEVCVVESGPRGASAGLASLRDREVLAEVISRWLGDHRNVDALRLLRRDYLDDSTGTLSPVDLERALSRALSDGTLVLRFEPNLFYHNRGLPSIAGGTTGPVQLTPADTASTEPTIRDWRIECHHHSAGKRPLFERGTRIQVVPDKGQTRDEITVHFKDTGAPTPPSLTASRSGAANEDVAKAGSAEGYDTYPFQAEYHGDIERINFLLPAFWRAYTDKTTYTLRGAPSSVAVDVFNPRQYKFEFKLPPLKSVKAGFKLSKDIERSGNRLSTADETKKEWTVESAGWSPSALKVTTDKWSSEKGSESETKAASHAIAFSVDGDQVSIGILQTIAALLNFYEACLDIYNAIRENAPQVGWYIDFNLQLMQGGMAIEWYWKEHTDHRVFQYVDFNLQLTIFTLTFELGVGISGLGFKAQIFAQLEGSLSVSANARRDDPDGMPGFAIPVKGTIKGALGARFEAGNLFKAEGKGETAIELTCEVGINRGRSKMFNLDMVANFTGIVVTATVSGGLFGMGRQRTWTRTLVSPRKLGGLEWPKPVPYTPPHVSVSRIKSVVLNSVTNGWNVRVIQVRSGMFNDVTRSSSWIADALAAKIDEHTTWHRTSKVVEALAHSVRGDLNGLGVRLGRDYIEETAFLAYVNGPKLQAHLNAAASPTRAAAKAAGG